FRKGAFRFQIVQQFHEICTRSRKAKLGVGALFINTQLQLLAKPKERRSRFNSFPQRKLLKQFYIPITAYIGLKPAVNRNYPSPRTKMLDWQFIAWQNGG